MDLSLTIMGVAALAVAGLLALWARHRRALFERYAELAVQSERVKRDLSVRELKVKQLQSRIEAYVEESESAEQKVRDLDVRVTQLSERLNEKWQLGRKLKGVVKLRKQNLTGLEAEIERWEQRLVTLRSANRDWALRQDQLEARLKSIKSDAFQQEDLVDQLAELLGKVPPILDQPVVDNTAAQSTDHSGEQEIDALRAHMQLLEGQLHYWQSKVSDLGFAMQDIASNDESKSSAG